METNEIMEVLAMSHIQRIERQKKGRVVPESVHIHELQEAIQGDLTQALDSLCKRGLLNCSSDINKNQMFSSKAI